MFESMEQVVDLVGARDNASLLYCFFKLMYILLNTLTTLFKALEFIEHPLLVVVIKAIIE